MKKSKLICTFLSLLCLVQLTSCVDFGAPKLSDSKKITTIYGDQFDISRKMYDFPDEEIVIFVGKEDENSIFHYSFREDSSFCFSGFANYLAYYDGENDLLKNWDVIIKNYQSGNTKAYQFNWGIFYSVDNGKNYTCVLKHEYTEQLATNAVFKDIYSNLT